MSWGVQILGVNMVKHLLASKQSDQVLCCHTESLDMIEVSMWQSSLEAPTTTAEEDDFLIFFFFFFFFFRENKSWHFMWIVSLADDSHEMSGLVFSVKQKKFF